MNTIKIILILFATLAYAEDFHEIKSQIQEEFNKNMLAKKNIIDAISTEVKNSFNEFKQHYEKIENRLCACADKNDTIFYCKLIKSEINLAYSLLQREFFALEMQAVAIDMFGSSIQLYEATLNSISNFTSAASCLIKTKSLFIGLFRSYFETTRDTIVKHVRKLEDGILVTQAEIDNFIAQRDANISLCAAKGESECDCTNKYIKAHRKVTPLKIKEIRTAIKMMTNRIRNETISDIKTNLNENENNMKTAASIITNCVKTE